MRVRRIKKGKKRRKLKTKIYSNNTNEYFVYSFTAWSDGLNMVKEFLALLNGLGENAFLTLFISNSEFYSNVKFLLPKIDFGKFNKEAVKY